MLIKKYFRATCSIAIAFALTLQSSVTALAAPDSWKDPSTIGSVSATESYTLKDDFYTTVNRDWLAATSIPDGKDNYGEFNSLQDQNDANLIEIMKKSDSDDLDQQIFHTYYEFLSDWDTRNALGYAPIIPFIDSIRSISSLDDMNKFLVNPDVNVLENGIVSYYSTVSFDEPSKYVLNLSESVLLLPDANDYTTMCDLGSIYKDMYTDTASYMLKRMGYSSKEAKKTIKDCFAYEALLAKNMYTQDDLNSLDFFKNINNVLPLADVKALLGNYPIEGILNSVGFTDIDNVVAENPKYLASVGKLYNEKNLALMKNYFIVHTVIYFSDILDRETYETTEKIKNDAFGVSGMKSDDQYYLDTAKNNLMTVIDNVYINNFTSDKMKKDIEGVIKDSIAYYRKMLMNEAWLSQQTKDAATHKLDSMVIHAVKPDKLQDHSGLVLIPKSEGGNLVVASLIAMKYWAQDNYKKYKTTKDRDAWDYNSMYEVNSYYNFTDNSINIIPGICGGLFYNENMAKEEIYGGIGAVIGHEISHAFDSRGGQFDTSGALADWWTPEDKAAFDDRVSKLTTYFDNLKVSDTMGNCNGVMLSGEAIADMAGIKCMLNLAAKEPDFDYNKFFTHYAVMWRRLLTSENELYRMSQDPHPLSYLRTNLVLAQYDEFLNTYGITATDGMYIAPTDRISVW